MAISGVTDYANTYAGYTNSANGKKQATEGAGTAKEAVARKTAKDELSYLTEKYECLKNPGYSVNINSSLLEKATSDEKTSEWLEYNLSLIPKVVDNIKSAAAARGGKMISCDITMNGYDSMTTEVVTQVEVDPGTEKARKELTEMFTVSAAGSDVKSVTQNLIATSSGTSEPKGEGFDIKV